MDLVHIPGLAEQLHQSGTTLGERAFTARERRDAARREGITAYAAEVDMMRDRSHDRAGGRWPSSVGDAALQQGMNVTYGFLNRR